MNPNREEVLFQIALLKSAAERAAWLDRECGEDKALRARIGTLLAAHEQRGPLQPAPRRDELHESPTEGQGLTEFGPPMNQMVGQKIGRPTGSVLIHPRFIGGRKVGASQAERLNAKKARPGALALDRTAPEVW